MRQCRQDPQSLAHIKAATTSSGAPLQGLLGNRLDCMFPTEATVPLIASISLMFQKNHISLKQKKEEGVEIIQEEVEVAVKVVVKVEVKVAVKVAVKVEV